MFIKATLPKRHRACAILLAACLALTACATAGSDPSLSPEENQLRAANGRFSQTVGEGATFGAVAGGIAGALLGGRNRLAGAAVGAAAGAALGGGAGYLVARNNAQRSHSEADYQKAIGDAQQEAAEFRTSAQSARKIADRAVQQINALDVQFRSRQITGEQYRAQAARFQSDNQLIQDQANHAQNEASSLRGFANGSGSNQNAILQTASEIDKSRGAIQSSASAISQALARVPQAGA